MPFIKILRIQYMGNPNGRLVSFINILSIYRQSKLENTILSFKIWAIQLARWYFINILYGQSKWKDCILSTFWAFYIWAIQLERQCIWSTFWAFYIWQYIKMERKCILSIFWPFHVQTIQVARLSFVNILLDHSTSESVCIALANNLSTFHQQSMSGAHRTLLY